MKLFIISALLFVSCGGEDVAKEFTAPELAEIVDASTSKLYLNLDELPECNDIRKSNLAFVESDKSFYVCDGEWKKVDTAQDNTVNNSVTLVESIICYGVHPLASPYYAVSYRYQRFSNGTAFVSSTLNKFVSDDRDEVITESMLYADDTIGSNVGGIFMMDTDAIVNHLQMNDSHTILSHKLTFPDSSVVTLDFSISEAQNNVNTCTLIE